jgi:hypothetical protein
MSLKNASMSALKKTIYGLLGICFIWMSHGTLRAQTSLSDQAEISILTIGPGEALYDRFGHSAFRVNDPTQNLDWAFNYGTYDFNAPNFYGKFVQGQMMYALSVSYFDAFFTQYKRQNRSVQEQTLNLSQEQKNQLFAYLQWNAQVGNRSYRYDFFYDNCATRIRDVLVKNLGGALDYGQAFKPEPMTFRQLIQNQVPYNNWGSVGMDIAIGAVVDVPATPWQFQFLPKYVAQAHAEASVIGLNARESLIKSDEVLFQPATTEPQKSSLMRLLMFLGSPLMIFSVLGLLLVLRSWWDHQRQQRCIHTDRAIWLLTGVIGIFLVLLWFATDHLATKMNYNLLWAMPTSAIVALLSFRQKSAPWMGQYQLFLVLMLILMVMHQFTGVQSFAPALWPLIAGLMIRLIYSRNAIKKEVENP